MFKSKLQTPFVAQNVLNNTSGTTLTVHDAKRENA